MEKRKMELKYNKTCGDCTVVYDVILNGEYSVIDFVMEVLENDDFKEGYINVLSKRYNPSKWFLSECCKIEYKRDDISAVNIRSNDLDEKNMRELMLEKIESASSLDCWNGIWYFNVLVR